MRKNKFVKLLEHILVLLPLLFVASVCLYTIFNDNAYLSYSDNYVETSVRLDSSNVNALYVDGQTITYTFAPHSTQWNAAFGFSDISIDLNEIFETDTTWNKFYLYNNSEDILFYTTSNQTYRLNASDRTFDTFSYKVDLSVSSDKAIYDYGIATIITFNNHSLDNAFTYSLDKFNQLGFDRINWVNWFTSIFITENNVYVTFLNSYLNYFLLVECCYVVPMVMYWFIHFCEHVLYKFENWGDKE